MSRPRDHHCLASRLMNPLSTPGNACELDPESDRRALVLWIRSSRCVTELELPLYVYCAAGHAHTDECLRDHLQIWRSYRCRRRVCTYRRIQTPIEAHGQTSGDRTPCVVYVHNFAVDRANSTPTEGEILASEAGTTRYRIHGDRYSTIIQSTKHQPLAPGSLRSQAAQIARKPACAAANSRRPWRPAASD